MRYGVLNNELLEVLIGLFLNFKQVSSFTVSQSLRIFILNGLENGMDDLI